MIKAAKVYRGVWVNEEYRSEVVGYLPMEYNERGYPVCFAGGIDYWAVQAGIVKPVATPEEAMKLYEEKSGNANPGGAAEESADDLSRLI